MTTAFKFPYDVFLSYSDVDKELVSSLAHRLQDAGLWVWFDKWMIRPGDDIVACTDEGLNSSRTLLLCMTESAFKSEWVQLERNTIMFSDPTNRMRRLVPLLLGDCEIPSTLRRMDYIDGREITELVIKQIIHACLPDEKEASIVLGDSQKDKEPLLSIDSSHLFNLPYSKNLYFTGRAELLQQLYTKVNSTSNIAIVQAIHGLGGVGKTQTAVEFIFRYRNNYRIIWWLKAEFAYTTLRDDYGELALELGLIENNKYQREEAVKKVRRWLETNGRWLLVFDNVEDPKLISDLLPRTRIGHVIVTSRNPNWYEFPNASLKVDVFERTHSIEYLLQRIGHYDKDTVNIIAELLGDLPLALDQAASYILETQITVNDYIELFRHYEPQLLLRGTPSHGYENTVAKTWALAFEKVNTTPGSIDLLRIISHLPPDKIPKKLFLDRIEVLPNSLATPIALNDAIAALRRYSLVDITNEQLSIHRLVRSTTRDQQTKEQEQFYLSIIRNLYSTPQNLEPPDQEGKHEQPALVITNLNCFYGRRRVLQNISISIPYRRITAFIGPGGSGKSALMKSIARADRFSNNVRVDGSIEDVEDGYKKLANEAILVTGEENFLGISIYDTVTYLLRAMGVRSRKIMDEQAEMALRSVGIWEDVQSCLSSNIAVLTPIQQRLIKLAQAIIVSPKILLIDSATMDFLPLFYTIVYDTLKSMQEKTTIIIASNDLRMVEKLADYTGFLVEGELIEFNTTEVLFNRPENRATEDFITGRGVSPNRTLPLF